MLLRAARTLLFVEFCLLGTAAGWAADDSATAAAAQAARDRRRTPIVTVFEQSRDAVVNIATTRVLRSRALGYGTPFEDMFEVGPRRRGRAVQSVGSGVVVHPSGYIVTNAHVVAQASDVQVTFADGHSLPADVTAVDTDHDLAVLKVDSPQPLHAQRLGCSDDIMVGETVVAIGNPLGLQHTVTQGIVSALHRELEFANATYRDLIQTDAPINPGNSGGPLLNINDELIGINTAIRGDAQNIGFAIPVDQLWELLPAMLDIERRQRVRFGLHVSGPDTCVQSVRPGSPAAKAGLQPGDHVLRFNGTPIQDAIDYHVRLLAQEPDSTVRLTVQRNDQQLDVQVPLETIPIPDGAALARGKLGMVVTPIPTDVRQRYSLPNYVGLMVTEVVPGGPAAFVGVEPGDLILRLDRVSVVTAADVGLALEKVQRGERVLVEGFRLRSEPPFQWKAVLQAQGGI